jgi:hypothetical protein
VDSVPLDLPEPQHPPPEQLQRVDPPQVVGEHAAPPVVVAFVLDAEPVGRVRQVQPSDEVAGADLVLRHRTPQPTVHEDEPQPGLHRRFSARIGQRQHAAQVRGAAPAGPRRGVPAHVRDPEQAPGQQRVQADHGRDTIARPGDVVRGPDRRGHRRPRPQRHVAGIQPGTPDHEAGPWPQPRHRRNRHLDGRVGGAHVRAPQRGRGQSAHGSLVAEEQPGGVAARDPVQVEAGPAVHVAVQPAPGRTVQLAARHKAGRDRAGSPEGREHQLTSNRHPASVAGQS